ncbi:MAG: MATE family efflux transporter, partial [Hyphomonadaceae bacterium]
PLHLFYCATAFFHEAIQRPMASTIVMWGANIVNLVLNLWFVPLYGAEGSAWATFGARVVLAGALAAWIFAMPDGVNFGVRFKAQGPRFGSLLRVGAAAAVSQMAEAGAFSAMTIIAGRIGETAVSAYQILLNVLAVVFMVALGMSTATAVLTSEAVGRRSAGDAARASWTGLGLNTLFMGVLALVVWIFAAAIARGYTSSLEVVALVAALMWIAAAVFVPDGGQVVAAQALRARGDNWFPTASHIVSYVVVMPPLAFYLGETLQMGVAGLMLAIFWASVLSVGILTLRMWWIARRGALPPAGESVPVSMGH